MPTRALCSEGAQGVTALAEALRLQYGARQAAALRGDDVAYNAANHWLCAAADGHWHEIIAALAAHDAQQEPAQDAKDAAQLVDKCNSYIVDNARLSEQVEELRKDAARLDYIESNARCDPKMDGQNVWWPTNFSHRLTGPTLRAAIDASIEAKK
jgi:hypothetical protein